jgi:N-acetyl-alpha-D-muramate 1-phosphate uridylyltransferase
LKAIILAAGRGERMRPLTDAKPKALLEAGGKPLIIRHIEKLAAAGVREIVINHAHLGAQIERALGDGARYGVIISYSREEQALETAGGIANALALLGGDAFAAVNADVYSEFDYSRLVAAATGLKPAALAHLVLVDNPEHNVLGDFALDEGRLIDDGMRLTFSGIAVYRPGLFAGITRGTKVPLAPLLREQIAAGHVLGEHYRGRWCDVGTPQRLAALNRALTAG